MRIGRKRFLLGVSLPFLLVGLIVVWGQLGGGNASRVYTDFRNSPPSQDQVLVLHSISYSQGQVSSRLLTPEPGALGASFQIVGARINELPHNVAATGAGGQIRNVTEWSVTIFVWNHSFLNSSTTNNQILADGVAIVESPAPASAISLSSAQALVSGGILCTDAVNSRSCTTTPNDGYLVYQNGFAIVVDPVGHQLTWLDDVNHIWVNVIGISYSISQLLTLAQTIR